MKQHKMTKIFDALPAIKQNEVAALADVSPQHLSALTKGHKKPTCDMVKRINDALDKLSNELANNRVKE